MHGLLDPACPDPGSLTKESKLSNENPIDSLPPPPAELPTERLLLRKPVTADAQRIFERWAQDSEVTLYLRWHPHDHVGLTAEHVANCMDLWEKQSAYTWMIETLADGELVGSLSARPGYNGINLGYVLARDAWGKGFMVEAVDPVAEWYLSRPEVARVWATCDADNARSARVLEKAGFEFEGILRRWQRHPNAGPGWRDERCYSRIRD